MTVSTCNDHETARARFKESLPLWRELDDKVGIASTLCNPGNVALDTEDYAQARSLHTRSLDLARELGDRRGIAECLEGLGRAAGAQRRLAHAARLYGAAQSLRDAIGVATSSREQAERARHTAAARDQMGEEACAATWAEGYAMSMEEAIAAALDLVPRGPDSDYPLDLGASARSSPKGLLPRRQGYDIISTNHQRQVPAPAASAALCPDRRVT